MDKSLSINLIYNITILLTVALIYLSFQSKVKSSLLYKIMLGACVGIAGLLIMSTAVQINSGVIFDARSILISVAGMFFGLIPTTIAGTMMIIYRIMIGGSGVYMGVFVILTTAIIGVVWHHFRFRRILHSKNTYVFEFYLFGMIVHIDMLVCMLALPKDQIIMVIQNTFLPIIILYPIGTYLLCILLLNQFSRNDLMVKLKESEEKYRQIAEKKARQAGLIVSLIDSIPDLIFYKNLDGVYLGCNIPFAEYLDKQKNDIIGKTDYDFFDMDIADHFRYQDNEMLKQKLLRRSEDWATYPDGSQVLLETLKTPYWDTDGKLIGILGICRDNTKRKQREDEISYIGYHDYLTGLYNRRFYEVELIRLDVEKNLPLTIVMGDVNGLKLINDSFGHTVGDELLKKVAYVIKNGCRTDDIIARFGGDEFVILLPRTDTTTTVKIIERINELLSKEKIQGIDISISFGYETKTNEAENINDILKNTENYMYRHKLFERASMRSKAIDMIMNTLYEKNNREMLHSKRVSKICGEIAVKMNLDQDSVSKIKLAGLMHDIGKIGIDENILNSPYKLNEDEWNEMKEHSEIGYRILSSANEFSEIAEYVLQHQEKWDGSGYPKGLKGEEISLEARIIAIADAYDAMTSYRTYGQILSEEDASAEISKCSGTQFDPEIVKIFI